MKSSKRKLKFLTAFGITSLMTYSQTPTGVPPTPYPASNAVQTQNLANNAWYKGGNTNALNSNNIFGTMWPSPIYTHTNGKNRILGAIGKKIQ